MADVPDSMPDTADTPGGNVCPVKSKRRRIVKCPEDNYYVKNEYHPTWRKYSYFYFLLG